MTDDRELVRMVDEALNVVVGMQKVMDTLIHRIRNLEARMAKVEVELEPQLIELTRLMRDLTGPGRVN